MLPSEILVTASVSGKEVKARMLTPLRPQHSKGKLKTTKALSNRVATGEATLSATSVTSTTMGRVTRASVSDATRWGTKPRIVEASSQQDRISNNPNSSSSRETTGHVLSVELRGTLRRIALN